MMATLDEKADVFLEEEFSNIEVRQTAGN